MTAVQNLIISDTGVERTLKLSPFRDLFFRAVVFATIASFATITGIKHFDPTAYLDAIGHAATPTLNVVGIVGLFMCIVAQLTKDLEASSRGTRLRSIATGRLAGLSRRLASDLTLWSFGALMSLLTSLLIVMTQVQLEPEDYSTIARTVLWMVGLIIIISAVNIHVRLPRPTPLASLHPAIVGLLYAAGVLFVTYFGLI